MASSQSSSAASPLIDKSQITTLPARPKPKTEGQEPSSTPHKTSANPRFAPQDSPFLNVQSSNSTPSSAFTFGTSTDEPAVFTFRGLHNASPQPPIIFQRPTTPQRTVDLKEETTPQLDNGGGKQQLKSDSSISRHNLPSSGFSFRSHFQSSGALESQGQPDISLVPQLRSPLLVSPSASDSESASYDVRDEPAPNGPFYTAKFQSILKSGIEIAKEAHRALEAASGLQETPTIHGLKTVAESLRMYRNSETKTIAVLGDSGEGRELLL